MEVNGINYNKLVEFGEKATRVRTKLLLDTLDELLKKYPVENSAEFKYILRGAILDHMNGLRRDLIGFLL